MRYTRYETELVNVHSKPGERSWALYLSEMKGDLNGVASKN
jgi:hypothetical protein